MGIQNICLCIWLLILSHHLGGSISDLRFPSRFHDGRFYVRVAAEKDVKDVNVAQDT